MNTPRRWGYWPEAAGFVLAALLLTPAVLLGAGGTFIYALAAALLALFGMGVLFLRWGVREVSTRGMQLGATLFALFFGAAVLEFIPLPDAAITLARVVLLLAVAAVAAYGSRHHHEPA
jgi:hypothetical protein